MKLNRWIKWSIIVCSIPIALVLLVSILLYIPSIQNFALKKATAYASDATEMNISIDRIRLTFPLNLSLQGVDVQSASSEKLLTVQDFSVSVNFLPLLKQEVSINGISLKNASLDTHGLIDGMTVRGEIGHVFIKAEHINLNTEIAVLDLVEVSNSDLSLELAEIQEEDTTSTSVNWQIGLKKIVVDEVAFSYTSSMDSSRIATNLSKVILTEGLFDLKEGLYQVERFSINNSSLRYDENEKQPASGFDASHIALMDVSLSLDSIHYKDKEINTKISSLYLKERSGLEVSSLTGAVKADTSSISIPEILLKTPYSEARLLATIPWSTLTEKPVGNMRALFSAFIGKEDVLIFAGIPRSSSFVSAYPNRELTLTAGIEGNLSSLKIQQAKLALDSAFTLSASGNIKNLTDSLYRSGKLNITATSGKVNFLLELLDAQTRELLNLPQGMTLTGEASLHNRAYKAELLFKESQGTVSFSGAYDLKNNAYEAVLNVDSLEPVHFLPQDSLYWLTAHIEAKGKGTNIYSKRTYADLTGKIKDIRYGRNSVSDVSLNGSFKEHQFDVIFDSRYPLAEMQLTLSGLLEKNKLEGMLIADIENIDFYGFHLTENPFSSSFQLFSEIRSDFDKEHLIDVTLGNWEMRTATQSFKPKTLTLHAQSSPDTTRVSFHTGDLGIMLTGQSDIMTIKDKLLHAQDNILKQLEQDSTINVEVLRPDLPEMLLTVHAKKDNPVYGVLQYFLNVSFAGLDMVASTSPEDGMRFDGGVYTIIRDSMLIDTIRMEVRQDTLGLTYRADVIKKKYLNQEAFQGGVYGKIRPLYGDAQFYYKDQRGESGLELGIRADKVQEGIRLTFSPEQPTLFFHPFTLNDDNYIHIKSMQEIDANLRLTGQNNASLWIHSLPEDGPMSELHAELSQIDLDLISKGFSFMPNLKGLLNADFQYAPIDSTYMLVADMNIDNLLYEGGRVGELMLSSVYLPLDQNNSQVDMHLYRDRSEIMNLTALYTFGKKDRVEGEVNIVSLPLEMMSPLVPDKMASLAGFLNGQMIVSGTTEAPLLNGAIKTDSASVYVSSASSRYYFEDKSIEIKNNLLSFNKYKVYASGNNPFVLDGTINMTDPSEMTADLTMTANNLQLLDVKRNKESLVYGKLFVNMNSTLKGPLTSLKMRGNLHVLGTTNVTYVMVESPLTVQDRLDGLVTFVSFNDTLFRQRRPMERLATGGLDVLLGIKIDPAVQMKVDLTPDRSSYVELEGGGDLTFQYTPLGDMLLNGRYTLTGGTVRYELPIVSAKNFTIKEGSYVDWTGDMMNPRLNLTATERVRTSVALEGQSSRMVNFDVGIKVQQTLENMALDFTLSAPEDLTMQSELTGKGVDDRRRLAVGMLVTGMYVDGKSKTSGMDMGSAISSFLQSEINSIAGSALKTVDISFGMENHDSSEGSRTDYSFRFAKRFYNDRIRIVIGGRLSSGTNVEETQADNFIDNVSIEYRLDEGGSRYVKLFHNKNYENLLEGEIIETGAGIVLKRRMVRFLDLFDFRKNKVEPIVEEEE